MSAHFDPITGLYLAAKPPDPLPKVASKPGRTRPALSEHAARLARLRAELVREGKAINRRGGVNRTGAKLRGALPTCCLVGCQNPRVPPAAYCVSCESELEEGE